MQIKKSGTGNTLLKQHGLEQLRLLLLLLKKVDNARLGESD